MIKNHLLITGATGSFGRYIFNQHASTDIKITALVRGEKDEASRKRLEEVNNISLGPNAEVLSADLEKENLGLSKDKYLALCNSITSILHAAASTRFNLSIEKARLANVQTTINILSFAERIKNLDKIAYTGTAFVSGKNTGIIKEEKLKDTGFVNSYDQSKYEAEMYVRSKMKKLPIAIYRPSLIVDSDSPDYNAALVVLNLVKKNLLPILPGLPTDKVDLISAADASRIIFSLFTNHFEKGKTYNITGSSSAPALREIIELADNNDFEIHYTGHNESDYDNAVKELILKYPKLMQIYEKVYYFIKYLLYPKQFDNSNVQIALGKNLQNINVLKILKERINR